MGKISGIKEAQSLIVTAKSNSNDPQYGSYDFVSRVFSLRVGINEDPVTGSAHCKLAHYWMKKLNKTEFLAYQASQRAGQIHLKIQGDRVLLRGNAITIMAGTWLASRTVASVPTF